MRRLLVLPAAVLLLLVPAAGAGTRAPQTAIFYYPWYGTIARDGAFLQWRVNGHAPPRDIASAYYPARGIYSSSDPSVLDSQMTDIAQAGIQELVVSWWGRGSAQDLLLPAVIAAAGAHGLVVAAHLEPYAGRTVTGTGADVAYLRTLGIHDFFVYRPGDFPAAAWAALRLRLSGVRLFAQTGLVGFAKAGGFDGVYTYDVLVDASRTFRRLCTEAHRAGLVCLPSVGPGYDARRATGDQRVKPRNDGRTYDAMWTAALRSGADTVTITSYNEWLEGTQIEPARARAGYESYAGAWGLEGQQASRAYLGRTAYWTARLAAGG